MESEVVEVGSLFSLKTDGLKELQKEGSGEYTVTSVGTITLSSRIFKKVMRSFPEQ
ncbi:MAG: hypothetical protein WKF92_09130 [Pyrinomonadaceae bacterium]